MKKQHYRVQVHSYKRQINKDKSHYDLFLHESLSSQPYLEVVWKYVTETYIDQKIPEAKESEILCYLSIYKMHHI